MDANAIVTALTSVVSIAGGFTIGRRVNSASAIETAVGVVSLLQAKVETLTQNEAEKDREILELGSRVDVLESLVTQRANVEAVLEQVTNVRGVVDRIAIKVEA